MKSLEAPGTLAALIGPDIDVMVQMRWAIALARMRKLDLLVLQRVDSSETRVVDVVLDDEVKGDNWSVTIYDTQTRSMMQTDQASAGVNSLGEGIAKNEDGSIDIYFAPKTPKGGKSNWIQTIPGKSWFIILRMYGPLEPWLNQTWRPSELELVE